MPKMSSFNKNAVLYEEWFGKNPYIYESELKAIQGIIPVGLVGMEVGIGTGMFALPLGIKEGVDPSYEMARIARAKGLSVIEGFAEKLPFADQVFDFVLTVTAICFWDDVCQGFMEIKRVLKDKGFIIVAFIDKDSVLGKKYESSKHKSVFYQEARFYSVFEVESLLRQAGFKNFLFRQTIFRQDLDCEDVVKEGYGEGSFVVIQAFK